MTQHPPTAEVDRPVVGSYPTCTGAQRAVDFLSDSRFPVEHTAIIGSDLRMVETVLGRLTRGRAALAGTGTGAWFGLLVGLLLSVFAAGDHHILVLMLSGLAYGAVFGAVFGFAGHALGGGHRDFSSRSQIVAARYDVVADADADADAEVAEEAKNLLITLAWREE
ncbi:general stress protein [Streptomyces sp. NPDC051051]|uniref:general stress protein n=1 Tax=Streptomyces sp. NPDC051051 TaxID=3155666 RepID=UPI003420A2EF